MIRDEATLFDVFAIASHLEVEACRVFSVWLLWLPLVHDYAELCWCAFERMSAVVRAIAGAGGPNLMCSIC